MEMNRELKDSIMKLSMLIRRLEMPRPHEPGLRGHAQKRALLLIALNEGISQRELCEKMGIQPSSASELLGKLEARGLINKAASISRRPASPWPYTPRRPARKTRSSTDLTA